MSRETQIFRGIPFAQPPIGPLRFAPPVAVVPWTEELDATATRSPCAQLTLGSRTMDPTSSEDCLYLNVWAPARAGSFPVVVWFPGGANVIGAGSMPEYDGQRLSEAGGVVVVTVNYRLGAFGFLGHAALRDEEGRSAGDYALLDQRETLHWVKRNIESFGGDPDDVTIFGESAGAGSVCMHMVSPGSASLFQRASLESAPCTGFDLPTRFEAEAQADALVAALGCSGDPSAIRACLRAASTEQVLHALPLNEHVIFGEGVAWGPIVDGVTIPDQPAVLLAGGASATVPVIVGSNADEGTLFFNKDGIVNNEAELRAALAELFDAFAIDAIVARYPVGSDPQSTGIRIVSDIFTCDARRIARLHTAAGGVAYHYHFTHALYDVFIGLGALHGAEIPFVFGNSISGLPVLPAGIPLKNAIQGYWSSFAHQGDPNGGGRHTWPRYDAATDRSLRLDLVVSELTALRRDACDFWDTLRVAGTH
jgi:para-nitrobenzyl esterase